MLTLRWIVIVGACCALSFAAGCGDDSDPAAGGIENCNQLCDREPTATSAQKQCVSQTVAASQPAVLVNPVCVTISSPESCKTCYQQVGVADGLCKSAGAQCF